VGRNLKIAEGHVLSVVVLHQGTPGQMTWMEDPPPWLRPA